jgi:hypothetical protein
MAIPHSKYDRDVLNWVLQATQEGEEFLRGQYGFTDIDKAIGYIQGDQGTKIKSSALSNFQSNRLGKVTTDIVAALTDIKPLFSYRTLNDQFKDQSVILNKLAQSWWLNNFIDLKLGGAIQLAIPAGCSYLHLFYNPDLAGGRGDIDLAPLEARDVIPIRPTSSISIQDSLGVVIKSVETANYLQMKYPEKAEHIKADKDVSLQSTRNTAFGRAMHSVISPAMRALRQDSKKGKFNIPGLEVFTVYLHDFTKNQSDAAVQVGYGPKGERYTWSYTVEPGEPLYPRGRTIICTRDIVLYDGPNVYWHGQFPVVKMPMDLSFVYPNSFLSKGLITDLMPHQDVINEIISGIMDAVRQALQPGLVADSRAVSHAELEKLNSRRPGFKMKINPTAGEGIKWQEPHPLPSYVFEFLQFMVNEIEYLSGSRDLGDLARVKQLPAADSMEALMQAMTPSTRLRGRVMEAVLREMADLLKFNFFQFYHAKRRLSLLGPGGLAMEDFDFDPGNLIPDGDGMIGHVAVTSPGLAKAERAIKHAHNFTFYITPNSMLEISLVTEKAKYLRLRSMGEIDHQTFLEKMEVPNIPEIDRRLSSEIDQLIKARDEAMAGSAGRPSTDTAAPRLETRGGGQNMEPTRPVVSTSQ